MTRRLFVYGTLQPGELRWSILSPLLADQAVLEASVPGRVYATPFGWPAAVFDGSAGSLVVGVVVELRQPAEALKLLDQIEGTREGLFRRQLLLVSGRTCWAYSWPHAIGSDFALIASWRSFRRAGTAALGGQRTVGTGRRQS